METKEINTKKVAEGVFVGCMFIGMAAGWFFDHFLIGMFAGMGVGFLIGAVIYFLKK